MRGVRFDPIENRYIVTFSKGYKKRFKIEEDAIKHRLELEKQYGIPAKGKKSKYGFLIGTKINNLEVVDFSGKIGSPSALLVKNLTTGQYLIAKGKALLNGEINGLREKSIVNQKINSNNTSGVKGVYYNKSKSKWCARIGVDGKRVYLGQFNTKQEAIAARLEAEEKYFKPILEKYNQTKGED